MRKKKKEPEKIGPIVWDVLRRRGYETAVKEQLVLQIWPELVGERVAEQTIAESLENGMLFVRVKSSAWQNELVFLKTEILKKINVFAGKSIVKDIIFKR
jgi:predicted nucleic acid-binding Zn ribbon protein